MRELGIFQFALSTVLFLHPVKKYRKMILFDFLNHEDVDGKHPRKIVKCFTKLHGVMSQEDRFFKTKFWFVRSVLCPAEWTTTNRLGKYNSWEGDGVSCHRDIDAWIRMKPLPKRFSVN
jgi:hypothetical protein